MTTSSAAQPGTEECSIQLIHGTSESGAIEIGQSGWRAADAGDVIARTAARFGTPEQAMWDDLSMPRSQAYARTPEWEEWASFTARSDAAVFDWAQRAPELVREASWN